MSVDVRQGERVRERERVVNRERERGGIVCVQKTERDTGQCVHTSTKRV